MSKELESACEYFFQERIAEERSVSFPDSTLLYNCFELAKCFKLDNQRAFAVESYNDRFQSAERLGFAAFEDLRACSAAIMRLVRERDVNKALLGRVSSQLAIGDALLVVGSNAIGAKSYKKVLRSMGLEVESYPKSHHQVFFCTVNEKIDSSLSSEFEPKQIEDAFWTCPGDFHWKGIDAGSQLLCESLPSDLSGSGVELGSASGYVSRHALQRNRQIQDLALVELFAPSLRMAERNLGAFSEKLDISFHWQDALSFSEPSKFDFVLCNPPRHDSEGRDSLSLGEQFIRKAVDLLCAGGYCYLVINSNLPYWKHLSDLSVEKKLLSSDGKFEVFGIQKL